MKMIRMSNINKYSFPGGFATPTKSKIMLLDVFAPRTACLKTDWALTTKIEMVQNLSDLLESSSRGPANWYCDRQRTSNGSADGERRKERVCN